MSKIPFVHSGKSITFYVGGFPYQASNSLVNFPLVVAELQKADPDAQRLIALVTPSQQVAVAAAAVVAAAPDYLPAGKVSVTRSSIRYDGEEITGVLVERILAMLADGFDIMPMIRFLENLYLNPAEYAREELYLWLENNNLPITEDGHFLAYKTVKPNFKSHHDGRTDNTPGTIVSVPRESVDTVRAHTCSTGLHFCSHSYLSDGPMASGVIVLLKINPADVVAIPDDYNNAKGRAWKYEVLSVVEGKPSEIEWASVVAADGSDYELEEAEDLLEIPSDLASALFVALKESKINTRQERLLWASNTLGRTVTSFYDLTQDEAGELLTLCRDSQAVKDANTAATVAQVQIDAINSYGIIALRRAASAAGYPNAWKGPKADDLRKFLIAKI
jgi:hypothetical protein